MQILKTLFLDVDKVAKNDYYHCRRYVTICLSSHLCRTAQLLWDGFSLKSVLEVLLQYVQKSQVWLKL